MSTSDILESLIEKDNTYQKEKQRSSLCKPRDS